MALVALALVLVPASAHAATQSAGNGIYNVFVDDANGEYTATTADNHPQGPGLNVLYGDGDPGTTFNSIRSYTSGTDYDEDGTDTDLSPYIVSTEPLGSTGFRTTWTLPGPGTTAQVAPPAPDELTITQDVFVVGTTAGDSRVVVTMSVRNDGSEPVALGIRYLWDYQIGVDDGPTFTALNPDGSTLTAENDFGTPPFDSYRIEDNDTNPAPPTFNVLGTANGPSGLQPPATTPDRLAYVCWVSSSSTSFDYAVHPGEEVAGGSNHACTSNNAGDSAVLYYWGSTEGSARTVQPNASTSVTAEIGLTPPGGRFSASVAGTAFNDADGDGTRGPGEAGMQGVTVFDDRNGNGQQDAGEAVTASGQDGAYTLNNVPGGSANIREVVPGGFRCTAPAGCAFSISLNVGDHLTGKDFGNTPVAAAVAAARCIDLRRFKFKVHHGPRSRVVKVQVFVDGKRVQQFKGRNLKAVTIEKFPQEFHAVRILVTLSNGSTRTSRRVYLECTKGKPKVVSHHHRRKPKSKKSPS